jgi:uncharacterized membrane protein
MSSTEEETRRRAFERFLLFTDAVMAIAVTLLILPVVDAVVDLENRDREVMDLIGDLKGELLGFLLGFAVIMVMWTAHQQVFSIVAWPNVWLVRLNMLWLLSITLLPFTTSLIADHGDEQATLLLYVGNVGLGIYCLGASTLVQSRSPHLLLPNTTITADDRLDALLNCVLISVAFILALLLPGLGFTVMVLMILDGPLKRLWRRREAMA